jgi:hypothetical protein
VGAKNFSLTKNQYHMNIKTRFEIGDTVWAIDHCKAVALKISSIVVNEQGVISYGLREHNTTTKIFIPEPECFSTREALISFISAS